MSIRIVFHIADIHLRNYHHHDQYRKLMNQMMERYRTLASAYCYEEVRIVIAGDLFHQKISISNEQTMLAAWFLNKLSTIGKVVIIPGNHDFLENNHGRLDSITPIINLIENENVTYYRESGVFEDENICWVVYSLYNHNKPPKFEREENRTYVGLFHGPINGASTDTGYVFDHGYETSIFAGLDMVLCGDIHKRFEIKQGNTPIKMVGSCIQQGFGENITGHGFGVWTLDTNEYFFEDLTNDSPFLKFRITDISDIEDGKEILLNLG